MQYSYDHSYSQEQEILPMVIRHQTELRPFVNQMFDLAVQMKYLLDVHEKESRVLEARRSLKVLPTNS